MAEERLDLLKIVVVVETEGVKARENKYRVKRTGKNFISVMLTPEEEATKAYSHSLSERVSHGRLMRVEKPFYAMGTNHLHRSIFCFPPQREEALAMLRKAVDEVLHRQKDDAVKLLEAWQTRPYAVERMRGNKP